MGKCHSLEMNDLSLEEVDIFLLFSKAEPHLLFTPRMGALEELVMGCLRGLAKKCHTYSVVKVDTNSIQQQTSEAPWLTLQS